MTKLTRKDVQKLAPEIIREFHAAGEAGEVQRFKRLLGQHASHLPKEEKDRLIEEFTRHAAALREQLRKRP